MSSSSSPIPSSMTEIRMFPFSFCVVNVTEFPSGVNFNAFANRLDTIISHLLVSNVHSLIRLSKLYRRRTFLLAYSFVKLPAISSNQLLNVQVERCNTFCPISMRRTSSTISIRFFIRLTCRQILSSCSFSLLSVIASLLSRRLSGAYISIRGVLNSWLILMRKRIFSSFIFCLCSFSSHCSLRSFFRL